MTEREMKKMSLNRLIGNNRKSQHPKGALGIIMRERKKCHCRVIIVISSDCIERINRVEIKTGQGQQMKVYLAQ